MSYSIGKLARSVDIGIETIRYYERRGLIPEPPRAPSGYRRYPKEAADRLRFIRRAKRLGFTLNEIAELLSLEQGGERAEVKTIAKGKLLEIDSRIDDLQSMRSALGDLVTQCSGRGSVNGCPIIEALRADLDTSEDNVLHERPIY